MRVAVESPPYRCVRCALKLRLCLTGLRSISVPPFLSLTAGAIGASLQAYFSLNSEDVAWLFTVYAAPNIVLVFLGGILMDKYGLVRTSLGFNASMLLGMILFAAAPRGEGSSSSMPYLLTGRFLLGLGGECLVAGASAMLARWFKKTQWLTFAMGFNTAAVQILGSAPAFVLLPWLLGDAARNARSTEPSSGDGVPSDGNIPPLPPGGGNVRLCLWVVVIVGVISLLSNVAYALVEIRYAHIFVPLFMDDQEEFENQMNLEVVRLEMKQRDRDRDREVAAQIASSSSPSALLASKKKPANKKNPKASQGGAYHIVQTSGIEEVEVAAPGPAGAEADELELEEEEEEQLQQADESKEQKEASVDAVAAAAAAGSVLTSPDSASASASALDGLSSHPSSPVAPGGSGVGGGGAEHTGLLGGLSTLWSGGGVHGVSDSASVWRPWQTLRQLSTLWWLVFTSHVLLSPILYSFSAFGPSFFIEQYAETSEEAGVLTSILYLSIIFAPLFGWIVDRVGFRCIVQCVAAGIVPLVFLLIHFTPLSPYLLMTLLGLAFAVTESNGLAMIADATPPGLLGTAYGMVGCGTSLALVIEPLIVGAIHAHTGRYRDSTILFIVVAFAGWLASFAVYVWDVNHDSIMSVAAVRMDGMDGGLGNGDHSVGGGGGGVAQGHGGGGVGSLMGGVHNSGGMEMSAPRGGLYPELEIVFDEDGLGVDHADDDMEEFRLDEFDDELP